MLMIYLSPHIWAMERVSFLDRFLHLQAKKRDTTRKHLVRVPLLLVSRHRKRLKGTPILDRQQTQLMLMIYLCLYMGDGTGVLPDRFLHLQGRRKGTAQEGKVTSDIGREIEELLSLLSHSLSSLLICCFLRFKMQNKGKEIS